MAGGMITAYPPAKGKKEAPSLSKDKAAAVVKQARECIEQCYEFERTNREEAATDLSFLAGNQWPDQVKKERDAENRPMLTINRLPQFVRQITNDIRQADIAIKVAPEDDQTDPKLARVFDGLIQQIQYRSSAKHVYSTAAEHQAGCGIGWFRICTEYADDMAFDQEIKLKIIRNPLSVYCDPAAVEPDRSDSMWVAVTEMIPKEAFKRKWPKAAPTDIDVPAGNSSNRPFFWSTDETVRIAEYWRKVPVKRTLALMPDGSTIDVTDFTDFQRQMLPEASREREVDTFKVEMYTVSGSEVLDGPHEWAGKFIPLVPVIGGEFPLEDKTYRYSAIRFARDPQQMYNYYRTAHAEMLALQPKAPYLVTTGMIGNPDIKARWDQAGKKNMPYLPYTVDEAAPTQRPERLMPPQPSTAMVQEGQIAQDDMKATTGIYDAGLGARSNETAGVAIRSRQAESDVANYHFVDNLQRSLEYAGRILIDLIPKIYDNERVIRLMPEHGGEGEEEFQPINRVVYTHDGMPMVINDLSAASFDIRVTIGKAYATRRMEAADGLHEFMKSIPPEQAALISDLFAKNLDFPEAAEAAKRLRRTVPPQIMNDPDDPNAPPPQPDPAQQAQAAAQQAELQKLELDVQKAQAELQKVQADAQNAQIQVQAQMAKGVHDAEMQERSFQLETNKAELQAWIDQQKLEIERQRAGIEREKMDLTRQQAEHSASMDVARHHQSEESEARKFHLANQDRADRKAAAVSKASD